MSRNTQKGVKGKSRKSIESEQVQQKQDVSTRTSTYGDPDLDSPQQRNDAVAGKFTTGLAVLTLVGSLAGIGLFTMTDIPDKILQARVMHVSANSESTTPIVQIPGESDVVSDDSTDRSKALAIVLLSLLPDGVVNEAGLVTHLDSMTDAEFDALIQRIASVNNSTVVPNKPVVSGDMPKADGGAVVTPNPNQALEDAYAEAERLYPGQIDGSHRLQLIREMNATSYKYYIAEDGDTLLSLSESFNIGLGQLVELNGIQDADVIRAGEVLLFPSDTAQPDIAK